MIKRKLRNKSKSVVIYVIELFLLNNFEEIEFAPKEMNLRIEIEIGMFKSSRIRTVKSLKERIFNIYSVHLLKSIYN